MEPDYGIADPRLADVIATIANAIAQQVAAQLQPAPAAPDFEWLKPKEAATHVRLSYKRLETLRRLGNGPSFERNGRRVRYSKSALDAWLRQRGRRKGASQ